MMQANPDGQYLRMATIGIATVDPSYHSQGIGTAMLNTIVDWSARRGLECCGVEWSSANLVSDSFWRSRSFVRAQYKLARRIDPRTAPTPTWRGDATRAHAVLHRDGHPCSRRKVLRVWREEGCGCGPNGANGAGLGSPPPPRADSLPNTPTRRGRWTTKFDVTTTGRILKILYVVDEHTRQSLATSSPTTSTSPTPPTSWTRSPPAPASRRSSAATTTCLGSR
jgi:GNAT superfamily N-acetyltransferase